MVAIAAIPPVRGVGSGIFGPAMPAVVLVVATAASRLLGFSGQDEARHVVLPVETARGGRVADGRHRLPATAVGPIVLPLMLFRQMQSMVCAALARRYGQRAGQAVPIVAERA